GKPVNIASRYVDRSEKKPLEATDENVFQKIAKVQANMFRNRREDVIMLGGCPVSVAEQVLALVSLGGLKNPYFDPKVSLDFTSCYLSTAVRTAAKRLAGQPYNQPGPAVRGESRPE